MSVLTAGAPPGQALRYQLDSGVGLLTPAERAARGKEARAAVPRDSHAVFDPPPDRPDPVALLEEQAATRVPELVPIRWGRMMVSPFTYYRGAALPMASDLARTPVSGLAVQACGDAHLSNFGIFGSPERRLVFDVNDFDETLPGPWEWDVKRLAASMEVAGRGNGFAGKDRREIVTATVASYRRAMREFAAMTNLDVWYARADLDQLRAEFDSQLKKRQRKMVDKGDGQGPDPGQHAGTGQAVPGGRRPAADRRRPAADRPARGPAAQADGPGDLRGADQGPARQVPAHAGNRPPVPARAVRVRRHGPQGRRRRQRRHPLLDRPDARPRHRDPLFLQVKEAEQVGAQPPSPAPASTPTRASGSSPASG